MANDSPVTNTRPTVRVGVFIPRKCQMLDAATVDVLGTMDYEYMKMVEGIFPSSVVELAPSVKVRYIGTGPAGGPIPVTSGGKLVSTHRYSDPEVAPGELDIVIVPGPDPFEPIDRESLPWLAAHGAREDVDILSVCTGIFIVGEAGLLRGKVAAGPRDAQDLIRAKDYGVKELVGDRYRWVQDGNLWSSGGVTNGNDMVAAYCQASPRFPDALVAIACAVTDVGDRPREYEQPSNIPKISTENVGNILASKTAGAKP
ncbi:ThiJ/PfpI family protein [Durotheca rogersii]|uniref:ThiJ/PfpI family protein n=1 Tax=Durotheca rogersii TaxID=419775 RepID=UPI00221FC76E|nr:ThiJ/PfpI family protein [Durotheca rogersii]KAI5861829.1 ThiJ/PfpI family protein [Durotheca rogersii]